MEGRLLAAVEDWWIGAGFGPGREAALAEAVAAKEEAAKAKPEAPAKAKKEV